jgi:tetratricopeptide (TPR) repeat protein
MLKPELLMPLDRKSLFLFISLIATAQLFAQSKYQLHIDNGLNHFSTGDFKSALVEFQKAHALDSTRVDSYYYSGVALAGTCRQTGDLCREAITMLNVAINIDPTFRKSFYNRGVCFLKVGFFEQAIKDFNQAILSDQADGDYYANRGIAKYYLNQVEEACVDFDKAIKLQSPLGEQFKKQFCQ